MSAIRCVEEIVPDIFVEVRLLSFCVPSTGEYAITGVFDVESFAAKYPVTLLSLTVDVWADKWLVPCNSETMVDMYTVVPEMKGLDLRKGVVKIPVALTLDEISVELKDDLVDLKNAASVRIRSVEIFLSSEDILSLKTSKDFEQGDVKGDTDSAVDSRKDLAEGVVTVSVKTLEVKIPAVLSLELPMPMLLVFNDATSELFLS